MDTLLVDLSPQAGDRDHLRYLSRILAWAWLDHLHERSAA